MEGAHRQLCAGFTNRLRRNNADRFTDVDRRPAREITAITGAANTADAFADQGTTDFHRLRADRFDRQDIGFVEQCSRWDHHFVGLGINDVFHRRATKDAFAQRCDDRTALNDGLHFKRTFGAAIKFDNRAILANINQTAREVARVRRLQCRVREALTSAVGRVEILKDGQAFLEVRDDRRFDDLARRLGHQAAHARKLLDLRLRTTRTRVRHHVDRVDRHFATLVGAIFIALHSLDFVHHGICHLVAATAPRVDHLVVLFLLRDQAILILLLEILYERAGIVNRADLRIRDDHVVLAERNACLECVLETQRHDRIGKQHSLFLACVTIDDVDNVADFFLGQQAVDDIERHLVVVWKALAEQHAPGGGFEALHDLFAGFVRLWDAADDLGVQCHGFCLQRLMHFDHVGDHHAFAGFAFLQHRQIIEAEDHVLRRDNDRLAVGGRQDVVGRHHQDARFQLCLEAQRHVHGHLVAVKVGVECRADERMKLDCLALDQDRFERLNAETVKRRCAVEHDGMFADDFIQNVPDFLALLFNPLLGLLESHRQTLGVEARVDERLEQLERHLLGQAALVELQFRPGHDDRTTRIIDAFAEQVLAEAALLALEHVRERLQRTLVGSRDCAAATAIVEQRVDRFLQHALFIADDDVGRAQFHQALQTVVAVDDAAIEIVQI